jgi:putative oxidoreductase
MDKIQVGLWAVRGTLALMFGIPAIYKLFGDALWAAEFTTIGFGMWFMYFVAAVEIVAVILVLRPNSSVAGTLLLLGVTGCALIAQITLFGHFIHIGIYGAILIAALALFVKFGKAGSVMA